MKARTDRWKRPLFALVAVVLFFAVAEGLLWLSGVQPLRVERDPFQGFSEQVDVFRPHPSRDVRVTPERSFRHSFNYQEFARTKPDDGFRFFVIGGSSAFGFPWGAETAFPRLLAEALQASYPETTVEGINAGAMSYGSHRLRILIRELLRYEPDALVIYSGHNELVERELYERLTASDDELGAVRRLLQRSRIYSAMTRAYEGARATEREIPEPGGQTTGELLGLDVDREVPTDVQLAQKALARDRFEQNLRAIIEVARDSGVTVVLCTVPSNLAAWAPNQVLFGDETTFEQRRSVSASLEQATAAIDAGRAAEAVDLLTRAAELAPGHAGVHFQLGRALAELERWDAAREAFVRARDTDSRPTRAATEINETIRRLADDYALILIDVEREFEVRAPHGLLGFELLEDYVHPNARGHRLIALKLWERFLEAGLVGPAEQPDRADFLRALGLDEDLEPLGGEAMPEAVQQSRAPDMLFNLAIVLENQGLLDEAMQKYRECVELRPAYWLARENLARLLFKQGQYAEAATEYRTVHRDWPQRVQALVGLGESLRRLGRLDAAMEALTRATEADPGSAQAWNSLGGLLAQRNRQADAEQAFRRAAALEPDDAETRVNLGLSLLFQQKIDEAEGAFQHALELQPHHLRARDGLAAALTERGRLDEAERIFRENLELDPSDEFARGGLAVIERRRAEAPDQSR